MPAVKVDGFPIHYREAGEGPPVVLIHGWPMDNRLWDGQIPVLAATHRVIALDLPGYGRSAVSGSTRLGLDLLVGSVVGLLDALGMDRASLAGHDIGGVVVLLTAIRHPERVDRLVVMDTTPYPEIPGLIRMMIGAGKLPGVGAALVSRPGMRAMLRLGTANRSLDLGRVTRVFRPVERDGRRALIDSLMSFDPADLAEVAGGLGSIEARTLVLWAEHDPTGRISVAERLAGDLPNATLVTVPAAGHFLQLDRPEKVAARLRDFLAE